MIDHLGIKVRSYEKSRDFYAAALACIGYRVDVDDPKGKSGSLGVLALSQGKTPTAIHLAFKATNRKAVHEFHAAALQAGGKDHGPPGPRPDYGPTYYAAFVLDPDGNNVEVVCTEAP